MSSERRATSSPVGASLGAGVSLSSTATLTPPAGVLSAVSDTQVHELQPERPRITLSGQMYPVGPVSP